MALFSAKNILADTAEPTPIELDFFVLPEGEDTPTMTVNVSRKLKKLSGELSDQYNTIKLNYRKSGASGEIVNNPVAYCQGMIQLAYVDSTGLIDEPSKKAVLALLDGQPKLAKKLAAKLIDLYESADLYTDEDDKKK